MTLDDVMEQRAVESIRLMQQRMDHLERSLEELKKNTEKTTKQAEDRRRDMLQIRADVLQAWAHLNAWVTENNSVIVPHQAHIDHAMDLLKRWLDLP